MPKSSFGKAVVSTSGEPTLIAQRHAKARFGADVSPAKMLRDIKDMRVLVLSKGRAGVAAAALAAALSLTACGRGPVEPIITPQGPTITIQLFVQGQITPSQGDYIIVLNTNTGFAPNLVNVNQSASGEQPGEPTIVEAYGSNPAPFTHWDQAFVYGSNPNGLPSCSPAPVNSFFYCYKQISSNGGQITIKFIPIILTPNTYTFNPNANGGSGVGNAIVLKLPISCLSIFANSQTQSCDTVPTDVTQIYVNFVTLDTGGIAQDQLACIAGQIFTVDLTVTNTQQLVKPVNCTQPPPPPNQNLLITGGTIQVNVPTGP
jgi:hypothetical protein